MGNTCVKFLFYKVNCQSQSKTLETDTDTIDVISQTYINASSAAGQIITGTLIINEQGATFLCSPGKFVNNQVFGGNYTLSSSTLTNTQSAVTNQLTQELSQITTQQQTQISAALASNPTYDSYDKFVAGINATISTYFSSDDYSNLQQILNASLVVNLQGATVTGSACIVDQNFQPNLVANSVVNGIVDLTNNNTDLQSAIIEVTEILYQKAKGILAFLSTYKYIFIGIGIVIIVMIIAGIGYAVYSSRQAKKKKEKFEGDQELLDEYGGESDEDLGEDLPID